MKILFTGSCGFLASKFLHSLIVSGEHRFYNITCVDNLMYQQVDIAEQQARYFKFAQADITTDAILPYYREADVIVNCAALVGQPICEKRELQAWNTNCFAVRKLCDSLSINQRLIFFNTNSGYQSGLTRECYETDELTATSVYGKTKAQAEKFVTDKKDFLVYRFATVYGASPRLRLDLLVNQLVADAYFNEVIKVFQPEARRNFVGIKDVERAIRFAIDGDAVGVYNCGNPKLNMTKGELANQIGKLMNVPVENCFGYDPDGRDYVVNNDKLLETGFRFEQSLADGVMDVVEQLKNIPVELRKQYTNVWQPS